MPVSRCWGFSARPAEGGKRPEQKRNVDSVGGNRKSFLPNQALREDHPGTTRLPTTRTSRIAMGPRPRRPSGLPARLARLLPLDWRTDSGKDALVIRSILVYAESQLRLSG